MGKKLKAALLIGLPLVLLLVAFLYLRHTNIPVLSPQGPVGQKERYLIILAAALSLVVVIPVFILLAVFAIRYREGNTKAKYDPNSDHSRILEFIWWAVPLALILILAGITWRSSHELDPFKPLSSPVQPLDIQVVAMDWKWLFIYPKQNIATVNFVEFPVDTPLNFEITADAPMNSFWIPQLGGQIYAMSGMSTYLHLMATSPGDYRGSSANISGEGFAGMKFIAKADSQSDFDQWVKLVGQTRDKLSLAAYNKLALPSKNNPIGYYSSVDKDLFNKVVLKYNQPPQTKPAAGAR